MEPRNPGDKPQRLVRQAGTFFLPADGGQLQAPHDEGYQGDTSTEQRGGDSHFLPSLASQQFSIFHPFHLHCGDCSEEVQEQLRDGFIPRSTRAPGFAVSGSISYSRSNPSSGSTAPKFTAAPTGTTPGQQTQPMRRSIPGEQRTPQHFAAASGGSSGAPTQEPCL